MVDFDCLGSSGMVGDEKGTKGLYFNQLHELVIFKSLRPLSLTLEAAAEKNPTWGDVGGYVWGQLKEKVSGPKVELDLFSDSSSLKPIYKRVNYSFDSFSVTLNAETNLELHSPYDEKQSSYLTGGQVTGVAIYLRYSHGF